MVRSWPRKNREERKRWSEGKGEGGQETVRARSYIARVIWPARPDEETCRWEKGRGKEEEAGEKKLEAQKGHGERQQRRHTHTQHNATLG